ncbi:hypothetical protein SteCoe_29215 [Stentor coeruleus]|uniref:Uncharacterized protein n=1 Tax=Stentor coeruleus TaxID=5963 RepID=A0A1R2B6K9_9CILI|nr:hypothetical protein SteCoe_29215 [Stentor coeruleus]
MLGGFDDDELIKAAYEIPDLQVSELQKDGPFYVNKDNEFKNPNYYQIKTKYDTYYRFISLFKRAIHIHSKHFDNFKIKAFFTWKAMGKSKNFEVLGFKFVHKWKTALKIFDSLRIKVLRGRIGDWRVFVHFSKVNSSLSSNLVTLEKQEIDLNKQTLKLNSDIKALEEKLLYAKEKSKANSQFSKPLSPREAELFTKNCVLLSRLQKENENLREKYSAISKIYLQYVRQISPLLSG